MWLGGLKQYTEALLTESERRESLLASTKPPKAGASRGNSAKHVQFRDCYFSMQHVTKAKDDGGRTSVLGFVRRKIRSSDEPHIPHENPLRTDSMQSFVSSTSDNNRLKRSSTIRVRAKDHTIHQQAANKVGQGGLGVTLLVTPSRSRFEVLAASCEVIDHEVHTWQSPAMMLRTD